MLRWLSIPYGTNYINTTTDVLIVVRCLFEEIPSIVMFMFVDVTTQHEALARYAVFDTVFNQLTQFPSTAMTPQTLQDFAS